jgi:hypothetical protein
MGWWFSGDRAAQAAALAVCGSCPVRAECVAEALALESTVDRHGIRGGLTAAERDGHHGGACLWPLLVDRAGGGCHH